MARIRTIKPEFWSDSKTGMLSDGATKLFIGLLNFSDDRGVIVNDVFELRAKIYPYAKEDPEGLITPRLEELIQKKLVIEFFYEGTPMLWIKNFQKHQVVDKPSINSLLIPVTLDIKRAIAKSVDESSPSSPGVVVEDSRRKGREGSIRLINDHDDPSSDNYKILLREEEARRALSESSPSVTGDEGVEKVKTGNNGEDLETPQIVDKSTKCVESRVSESVKIYGIWREYAERNHPALHGSKSLSQSWIEGCKVIEDRGGTAEEVERVLAFVEKDKPRLNWDGWVKVITNPERLARHYFKVLEQMILLEEKSLGLPRPVEAKSRDTAQEASCRTCKKRIILTPKGWMHMPTLGDPPKHEPKPVGILDLKPLEVPEAFRAVIMRLQKHYRETEKGGGGDESGLEGNGQPDDTGPPNREEKLEAHSAEEVQA